MGRAASLFGTPRESLLSRRRELESHEAAATVTTRSFGERDALIERGGSVQEVRTVTTAAPPVDVQHRRAMGHEQDHSTKQ
jgi:hypothetical protein